jgi:hypothetical protein
MKPVNIYLRIVLAALSALAVWGLLCPICISADIDIVVIFGILMIVFEPLLIYWIIKPIFKTNKQVSKQSKTKKENEKE